MAGKQACVDGLGAGRLFIHINPTMPSALGIINPEQGATPGDEAGIDTEMR